MLVIPFMAVMLVLSGCVTPHQEWPSGLWTKLAKPEERSGFGTNQSFARLERCEGPAEKKPWYKFYFESDFKRCVYLSKSEQDEWVSASSRGSAPEILSALIIGGSIGAGVAFSGATNTVNAAASSAAAATSASTPILNIRGHYGRH
jgi:hypothetical protein